jgi:hypothetical protein
MYMQLRLKSEPEVRNLTCSIVESGLQTSPDSGKKRRTIFAIEKSRGERACKGDS